MNSVSVEWHCRESSGKGKGSNKTALLRVIDTTSPWILNDFVPVDERRNAGNPDEFESRLQVTRFPRLPPLSKE